MAEVLAEALGVLHARGLPLRRAPRLHLFHEIVYTMVLAQPRALALVARQHPRLVLDHWRDVDAEPRRDRLPESVLPFERIAVEEVRDVVERRVALVGAGAVVEEVPDGRGEGRGADQFARLLV